MIFFQSKMTLGHNRTFYAKPIEFERFAASGQHADVILVTKENLHISAHKELNLISAKLSVIWNGFKLE